MNGAVASADLTRNYVQFSAKGTPMKFAIATGAAGALAAAALGLAGAAGAARSDLGSAADIVKSLQDQGYNVMLNGTHDGPLSECSVNGIHPTVSGPATQFTSVYVDMACPSSND